MIAIILPWLDHRLGANGRGDRRSLTGARRQAHADGYLAALDAIGNGLSVPAGPLEISITFRPPDHRRRDLMNLAEDMKSPIDGIFKALERDDSEIARVVLIRGEICDRGEVEIELGGV